MSGHSAPWYADPLVSRLVAAAPENLQDDPNYYARTPGDLITTSTPYAFSTGTGSAIYNSLLPLLESTSEELVLVTCFWARSSILSMLDAVLRFLSNKAVQRGTTKIRVRLCFSSLSLFQKLFHTPSVSGQEYDPKTWVKKLGLPPPEDLGGLDLRIKSVFLLPFSVMHPKFMIIDRKTVVLPSCNISWEEWFEGAMVLSGDIVDKFLEFYCKFWERRDELRSLDSSPSDAYLKALLSSGRNRIPGLGDTTDYGKGHVTSKCLSDFDVVAKDVPTIFLPSPHRRNPHFQPFASMDKMRVPPTPLNSFFLLLLEKAERSIRIQTPNLTSPPVLSALLKALTRGVDVRILTSARLMILEQLVTAGTTTSFCVKRLIRRYKKLIKASSKGSSHASDEEAAIPQPRHGRLQISYFAPVGGLKRKGQEDGEPQQSHLKMLIVDDEALVLGSGNLDRASWFTSQELGVAFFDRSVVDVVQRTVDTGMQGREKVVYDSSA